MNSYFLAKLIIIAFAMLVTLTQAKADEFKADQVSVYSNRTKGVEALDALTAVEEAAIIREAVQVTYPDLPEHLKQTALKVTFFVDHDFLPVTKIYMGFAAEDDPAYRYPDQTFYHPTSNPQGTIRVNYTEKFVKALQLMSRISKQMNDPVIEQARIKWIQSVVAHELLHAWQYHTGPVLDFERMPGAQMAETEFEKVLVGHRQKIQYEHDAAELTYQYLKQADIAKLANAVIQYQQQNPEQFSETGTYRLLSNTKKNPFVQRYLLESSQKAGEYAASGDLGHSWKMIYQGQIEPAEVLKAAQQLHAKTIRNEVTQSQAKIELVALQNRLAEFTKDELWIQAVRNSFKLCGEHADQAQKLMSEIEELVKSPSQ